MTAAERNAAYQQRLQQRLDRRAEDTAYTDMLRVARFNTLMETPTRVRIDGLEWCAECHRAVDRGWTHDPACSLGRETPDRGPLFDLAADLARQEAGYSVKVGVPPYIQRQHPLGDRITLVRDSGAA